MGIKQNQANYSATALITYVYLCLVTSCSLVLAQQCPNRCRCDRLNTVDCSGLAMTKLPSFTSLPRGTTRLLLQKNNLRTIPSGAFQSVSGLNIIDLSDNAIEDIEPRAFNGLQKLVLLDLQRNQLRTIEPQAFNGIGGNSEETHGKCRIDLRYNNIEVIKKNAFAWVRGLSLRIGNSWSKLMIKEYAFYGMRDVPDITIKDMKQLTVMRRAFTNCEQLGKIEVSDTNITAIQNFTFEGLTGLQGIHLKNCTIGPMETYAFAGIKYIKDFNASTKTGGGYFILSKSRFTALPQDAFRNTNLATVTLSDNSMVAINPFAFRDMANLKSIHIRNNSLEKLSPNSFATLRNLEELIFHGNKMSNIEGYAFSGSGFIKTLSIGQNKDVRLTLHPNAFSKLFDIDFFEITNLSSLVIMPNAFNDVVKVQNLKIENVSLPTLQKNSFTGLRLVGSLNIAFCNVTAIQPGAFGLKSRSRSAIDNFDMSQGNKIQCDCHIREVLSEFQSTFSKYETVQCVKVSESGTVEHVPIYEVPVCAADVASRNIILLLLSISILSILTNTE